MKLTSKTEIRSHYRELRKKILPAERQHAALFAAKIFTQLPIFKASHEIACYLPLSAEFDDAPIIEAIWQAKKNCYVPIVKEATKTLCFVPYKYGDGLQLNCHSILEPVSSTQFISPQKLDMVIVPLLAFDRFGHRLGTGSGYYDKTFAFLNAEQNTEKKPLLLGLAYTKQQIDQLPTDKWDILLNAVLTEKEMIWF